LACTLDSVTEKQDADLLLISSSLQDRSADRIIDILRKIAPRKKNIGLILVTGGGSADAAFQIARYVKRRYKRTLLYVFGSCKSAGTLIAVAADEIIM
jgi:ClpP class serine protease